MAGIKRRNNFHVGELSEYVELLVGGVSYTIDRSAFLKYPEFVASILPMKELASPAPIVIDRDGKMFQYIYDFLRYGTLPRDKTGNVLIEASILSAVQEEADYYQLTELVDECKQCQEPLCNELTEQVQIYTALHRSIDSARYSRGEWTVGGTLPKNNKENKPKQRYYNEFLYGKRRNVEREFPHCPKYRQFVDLLRSTQAPFCISGVLKIEHIFATPFYKSSSMVKLNLQELIQDATLSPFGRGAETVIDTQVRYSYEIDVSDVEKFPEIRRVVGSIDLSPLIGHGSVYWDLRPYKLVIYQEGGHFDAHRDTVRGDGHIGTLVVILNSEYTGGELEVTHSGRSETVTGAYSWVAMYGDCLHQIHPVTSGRRVSLVFDICNQSLWKACTQPWKVPAGLTAVPTERARGADEEVRRAVVAGMREQLQGYDSAVIGLQHLYPACQANPTFLKGGDQLLYDILKHDFELAVLPCTVYSLDLYDEQTEEDMFCVQPLEQPALSPAETALVTAAARLKTKVILMGRWGEQVREQEYEYTGNESQGVEHVYIVATLQVRAKTE